MRGISPIIAELIIIVSMLAFISFLVYLSPIDEAKNEYTISKTVKLIEDVHLGIEEIACSSNKSVVIGISLPEDLEIRFKGSSFLIYLYIREWSVVDSIYNTIKIRLSRLDPKIIIRNITVSRSRDAYIINVSYNGLIFNPDTPSYGFATRVITLDSFGSIAIGHFVINVRSIR